MVCGCVCGVCVELGDWVCCVVVGVGYFCCVVVCLLCVVWYCEVDLVCV